MKHLILWNLRCCYHLNHLLCCYHLSRLSLRLLLYAYATMRVSHSWSSYQNFTKYFVLTQAKEKRKTNFHNSFSRLGFTISIYFIERKHLKTHENAFCFTGKALFVPKIFKFLNLRYNKTLPLKSE